MCDHPISKHSYRFLAPYRLPLVYLYRTTVLYKRNHSSHLYVSIPHVTRYTSGTPYWYIHHQQRQKSVSSVSRVSVSRRSWDADTPMHGQWPVGHGVTVDHDSCTQSTHDTIHLRFTHGLTDAHGSLTARTRHGLGQVWTRATVQITTNFILSDTKRYQKPIVTWSEPRNLQGTKPTKKQNKNNNLKSLCACVKKKNEIPRICLKVFKIWQHYMAIII
jgi:hypothetical protein